MSMDFDNQFSVSAPVQSVWDFMLDAEEVAPCVPGAQITEIVDATHFRGIVKIKLGAVQMTYLGELALNSDESSRTIVLVARGTETRGSGGAAGTFTTTLSATDNGTQVDIHSHVDVTGRVAQFGRSIMQDVSNRLIQQFSSTLETKLQMREKPATPPSLANTTESRRLPEVGDGTQVSADSVPSSSAIVPGPTRSVVTNELRLRSIVGDLLRARSAAVLRALANRVDPK